MIRWLFSFALTLAQAAGPSPSELLCRALAGRFKGNLGQAIQWVDEQIGMHLGPVKLDPGKESTDTILKAAEIAAYLMGEGSDPLERQLLADAKAKKIVVELASSSEADPRSARIWLDRTVVGRDPAQRKRILRHELSHKLYHKPEYLLTNIPEWIFIREVDANLYAGLSLIDAVRVTFENYGGKLGNALEPYSRGEQRGNFLAIAKNIFRAHSGVVADFDLLASKLNER